jgi:hypothetical protein
MPEVAKMCEPEADFGCTVHVLPCTMLMEHPLLTHRGLGESYLILLPSPDDPMCHHTAKSVPGLPFKLPMQPEKRQIQCI